ncbi:MAG: coenzyme F420-0:L-glutamate ligase [Candidatus Bathyarchaeia archaeon]
MICIIGLEGIPVIRRGDDLGCIIAEVAEGQGVGIADGDVVVVTQKIVSKSEGMLVELSEVEPSDFPWRSRTGRTGTLGTSRSSSGRPAG